MIAILVGIGPNSIEIPAMLFKNFNAGVAFCEERIGRPGIFSRPPDDRNRTAIWENHKWESDEWSEIVKKFFRRYYDGCGDCFALELREVDFATPLVSWDLD